MAAYQCYHCKEWIEKGAPHDCWTTTEAALTADLSDDLRDAWQRLRETATDFGEQRIYASHHSIMFSRKSCYFFVRPKRKYLEVVFFVGRPIVAPQIRNVIESSKTRRAHVIRLTHRDEVEAPVTDWLREAYDYNVAPAPKPARSPSTTNKKATARRTTAKPANNTVKREKAVRGKAGKKGAKSAPSIDKAGKRRSTASTPSRRLPSSRSR
jgi:hypothetical protein